MADFAHPILFFDGDCTLCNGAVQFILRHDRGGELRFASLQSGLAHELLPPLGVDPDALKSLVLYRNGRAITNSAAALRTAVSMGGPVGVLGRLGLLVPRGLRDGVYKWISRNRYRWFGKQAECMLPRPEWRHRFVG